MINAGVRARQQIILGLSAKRRRVMVATNPIKE
jgi:hypothetical protein